MGVVSDSGFLGWGNWVSGAKPTIGDIHTGALNSTHYLVGKPVAVMPSMGTANYVMAGGTVPTATHSSGATATGQLISASMRADFGAGTAIANVNTVFGTTAVNIASHLVTFQSGTATFGSAPGTTTTPSGVTVSGFFTGNQAYRAGLLYSITPGSTLGVVTGAVALQRGN